MESIATTAWPRHRLSAAGAASDLQRHGVENAPPPLVSPALPHATTSSHLQRAASLRIPSEKPSHRIAAVFGSASAALLWSKRGSWARNGVRKGQVARRFFPFQQEPELDPTDPGRPALNKEYQLGSGTLVDAEKSEFGWAVVKKYTASEQDGYWVGDVAGKVSQEWRELLLAKVKEGESSPPLEGKGQSVVKVSISDGHDGPVQVPYCTALGYTKSMCSAVLAGAHLQGALPMENLPVQRALVIGLGGGSIPLWLNHTFPEGRLIVDVAEIDPAVIHMATKGMGFPEKFMRPIPPGDAVAAAKDAAAGADGMPLRVYLSGGETFMEELAKLNPEGYQYDYVFFDAVDKTGKVPEVLVSADGPFLPALKGLLAPRATLAINLLVGMTGKGSSGGPKEIMEMISAIYSTCCDEGEAEVFTVRTPFIESSGNQIYAFLKAGRPADARDVPLKEALAASGEAVNAGFPEDSLGSKIRFDLTRRLSFSYEDWKPGEGPVSKSKGGSPFGFF